MAYTSIALCTRALLKIGAMPINGFDDGSAESEVAGALYPMVRDGLLSSYPWSFSSAQITLPKLSQPDGTDYKNSFQLPSDFLRALTAGTGVRGRRIPYRIQGKTLQADADTVLLTYIFRTDESGFPPFFANALVARLAAEFCLPLTENTSRTEAMLKQARDDFETAKRIDAQQDTPMALDDYTLIKAR